MWLLFFALFIFVSGPVFVHRAAIAWQDTRLTWIAAAVVNVLLGLGGMHWIYRELLADLLADRKASGLSSANVCSDLTTLRNSLLCGSIGIWRERVPIYMVVHPSFQFAPFETPSCRDLVSLALNGAEHVCDQFPKRMRGWQQVLPAADLKNVSQFVSDDILCEAFWKQVHYVRIERDCGSQFGTYGNRFSPP